MSNLALQATKKHGVVGELAFHQPITEVDYCNNADVLSISQMYNVKPKLKHNKELCAAYFWVVIPSFDFLSVVLITKILSNAFKFVTAKFCGNPLLDNSHDLSLLTFL